MIILQEPINDIMTFHIANVLQIFNLCLPSFLFRLTILQTLTTENNPKINEKLSHDK